jgi:tetratricopeptide (TPR) repeat protein
MAASWDVFFSYRWHDLDCAQPLLDALALAGVRVWLDLTCIPDHESITAEIRHGLANSRAFLAFYSRTYPESKPCQQESTMAWLAAQQIDPNANRRFWIVNPEVGFDHIPELFRDQNIPLVADVATTLRDRLRALGATLLGSGVRNLPEYHGMSPDQARYFTGRARELWDLHAKLTANRISIITGVYGQATAQVRGLGGNGKSLLAREYAIRFGPAYPGGVFWLRAYGNDDAIGSIDAQQRESLRQDQIREFAVRLGVQVEGLKPPEIETAFWRAVTLRDQPCLWIVDDLPSGLSLGERENHWNARWAGASTLVTTRSKEYGAMGSALDLGVLSPEEALGLLGSRRKPAKGAEEEAAQRIVDLLGYHPLAVEVAASYLALGVEGFERYVAALEDPREDAVEFGSELKESLPTGHERSIAATLVKSIRHLGPEGLDFLRLASVLAVAPIQAGFVAEVFDAPEGTGRDRAVKAVDQAGALSLCEPHGADARTVHTLVSRTMRFRFPDEERTSTLRSAAVRALKQRIEQIGHIGEHLKIAMDMPHARHLVTGGFGTEDEAMLALWVARRDYERGDYASARKLQEQALAALRRVLGEEHPDTLAAMGNLAQTLEAQGDLAGARKLGEQVLAARRRVLGEEHPDTLAAMNDLAATLHAEGDLDGARELQEQVLAAFRGVLSEEHPDTLTATSGLAVTLYAQGDLAKARKLEEQVLAARRRLLGEEHPGTLTAMNNLAMTLYDLGDLAGAQVLQEQVLAALRRALGEEHPNTLAARDNLARIKAGMEPGGR